MTCLIPNPDCEIIKTKTKTQHVQNKNQDFIANTKQEQNKIMTKKHIQNLC